MVRTPWIGGNWKCNGTVSSITELAGEFNTQTVDAKQTEVVIFPAAIHIALAKDKLKDCYEVGCQNVSATGNGAFTGEVSVQMASDFGLKWALVGHSERRQFYGETNELVAKKVAMIMAEKDLKATICIGELLSERESNKTMEVCKAQLDAVIPVISDWSRVVIAYEPVWAIGTGKVATPQQAQEVHREIRQYMAEKVGKAVSENLRIVYGGSVSDSNCVELITCPDVDGFLVGGVSLKKAFLQVIASPMTAKA